MPSPAPRSEEKPATQPTSRGALRHIPYYSPHSIYVPVVLMFALLHYTAFATTADPAHPGQLLAPPYLQRLEAAYGPAQQGSYKRNESAWGGVLYLAADFFERSVVQHYYSFGAFVFGAGNVIWVVIGAWIIHLFELGMCVRICVACRAKPLHMLLYMAGTATAGFAQLGPLMKARNKYVKSQKGEEEDDDIKEDKKKK